MRSVSRWCFWWVKTSLIKPKENLIYLFNSTDGVLEKAREILQDNSYKVKQRSIRDKAFKQKVDVNKLIEWFILNYPESHLKLKKNPGLQFEII